ncbi:peptidase S9 [Rhodanobacter sp. FW510-R12]|uniref:S9 family peptidase n=1 Tax=unclassified Rhodanobacter TaxID=2621553 RepID=UPI0007A9CBA8|nr:MULTISPECIES: S9 family peptidase [unclassified Rhodanobacter]KZC16685.1 peptidase S9 [Rhodanobacter sp. FW104-R8]KZC27454.1 peptidase S9 [Rhodanobacter sp. FW510-T8]KZC31905.1 peptidase S9 [Rhodanobacter sp. FW510-R10]
MPKRAYLPAPLLLLALALAPPAFAAAPAVDPRIEQVLAQLGKAQSIQAVAISPDGKQLAWVIERDGKPAIERADADGRHAHRVSAAAKPGECAESGIAWAPDSRHLAFIANCHVDLTSTRVMQNAIYLADTRGNGAPARLAELQGYVRSLQWTADGKSLGFLYVSGATRHASAVAAAKPAAGEIGVSGVEVQRVASLDVASGALHELTPASLYAYEFDWSPDGSRIAYTAAPPPGDNNWWIAKLYVQPAQSGADARVLVDPADAASGSLHGLQIALPRWSPDASRIAFIGGLMSDQGATGGDIYAAATDGGTPVELTPGIRVTPVWLRWSGPQSLLVSQVSNGQSQLADYAVTGDRAQQQGVHFTVPASIGDGSASMAMSLSADLKRIAFVQSSYATAAEVHAGAFDRTPPPAVTALNAALKPAWGKAESVEWNNEGFHVQGWLLYPANYDAKKRYPMIVVVHGGPSSAVIPRWPGVGYGGAPLAALGYFVFMPNPRGSFGQGERFVQANRKDFGHGDLRDLLAGVDAVEKKVPVDDQRLGLTGWSYGGFMSMFAPTQTQRFRAVVAGAGISNWQSYYGQNLIDQWMPPFFGASVYDDPAVYAKSSAINFIKQVKTPMLIVVGDRDAECPAPQSFEMWHALRAQGVPTSLVVYPNEGHHFVNPAHQRDVLQRALAWFGKYLPATN